jgi:glycosyltransferase involved in cell wall biosynthesis
MSGPAISRAPLHVGMCVRVLPGSGGGIAQATLGLIHALGKLEDGPERYSLVVRSQEQVDWLAPHIGPNQKLVVHPSLGVRNGGDLGEKKGSGRSFAGAVKRLLGPFLPAARRLQHLMAMPRDWPEVPVSDGFFEGLGCDIVHFPTQWFMLCNRPSVYNPHDLQHLAYPQYFTQAELTGRETLYPAGCRYSHTVIVGTQWVKDDLVKKYGTDRDKVQVIPWAPPTELYQEPGPEHVASVKARHGLDRPFAFFPAVTWPHKNHIRLLEALAWLRDDRGLVVPLVCTGSKLESHFPRIEARIRELNLGSQVKFLGFVSELDLRALYRLSQFLVMPTLYEADSCPIFEAWHEGVPVASSDVTALPDQVQDAGILYDAKDVTAMAEAIARLATDEALRADLKQRGLRRVRDFSWERTARAYRAVYRRASDATLTEEDRWLLTWDWMREPYKKPEAAKR